MFDTHCHLNFKRFTKTHEQVVEQAWKSGLTGIVVPGTDIASSRKAVEIAQQNEHIYAAVGIHPHHAKGEEGAISEDIQTIRILLEHPRVVAIGEVGVDAFEYTKTQYKQYHVTDVFIQAQKKLFCRQIHLALEHEKALIVHCREAVDIVLEVLAAEWDKKLEHHAVFHCCEPDGRLLDFAKAHNIYIGVDGDVTYAGAKEVFAASIPLSMLVTETDSPYLLPEPMRSRREYPNEPKYLPNIIDHIAKIQKKQREEVIKVTENNAVRLFQITP